MVKPRRVAKLLLGIGTLAFVASLYVQFASARRFPSSPDTVKDRVVPIYVMHRRVYSTRQEARLVKIANWLGLAGGGAAVLGFMLLGRASREAGPI